MATSPKDPQVSEKEHGLVRAHLLISGKVQGVFYRAKCRDEAGRRGLGGWVRNLPDGNVEAVAEGGRPKVEEWIAWCRKGPPGSVVQDVKVKWEAPVGEIEGFRVASSRPGAV